MHTLPRTSSLAHVGPDGCTAPFLARSLPGLKEIPVLIIDSVTHQIPWA